MVLLEDFLVEGRVLPGFLHLGIHLHLLLGIHCCLLLWEDSLLEVEKWGVRVEGTPSVGGGWKFSRPMNEWEDPVGLDQLPVLLLHHLW